MYVQSAPNSLFDDMLQVWRGLPCTGGAKVPAKKSFHHLLSGSEIGTCNGNFFHARFPKAILQRQIVTLL